jgi:hypothetical protein
MINHMIATLAAQAGIDPADPQLASIGNNPAALKLMHQVVKLTTEDNIRRPTTLGDLRTPAQRADAIMKGKDSEWSTKYKEGDKEAVDLVFKLLGA